MIGLESNEAADVEPAISRPASPGGWGPFRRRGMARVLVICSFIVLTVWGIHYASVAGEVAGSLRENKQPVPIARLVDPLLIAKAFPAALVTLLDAVVGFYALLRLKAAAAIERSVLRALGSREQGAGSREHGMAWIALGLAIVVAAIGILEWIEPFYFVQDDNFANVLPGVLQGCRSMFRGEFPDFDPYQYMGMPNAGKGIFALFYPPTIASYAIARWVLGNENWTIDVFAAMHLLAGYAASFAAARMAGLRPALAFALGISFVLSGYILLVGRGWHAVLTLVVWLPLLFCAMEAWLNGRSGWRWLIASGLTVGGLYYNGFPQYWIYAMLFMALVALTAVAGGRIAARRLMWPAAAGLLGIALLMPSLVVQLEITRGMAEKPANFGMGFDQGLVATIAPFPLSRAEGVMFIPTNRDIELENQFYYAGTILMAGGFVVLGALLAYRCSGRWLAANPWTVAAVVSLWLGFGSAGLLWTLMGRLPVLRALNHHPHRLLPFFTFFALIIGGRFIERLLRGATSRKWEYTLAAATAGLMLYHVSLARDSFWCYGDRPYPQLPPEIAERLLPGDAEQAGRVLWIGPWRSGRPGYAWLLPHSLPSAYGACAFGGYDPIIENRPETQALEARFDESPVEAARAYGIRWILVANPEHYRPERGFWQSVRKSDWCFDYMDEGTTSSLDRAIVRASELRVQQEELQLYELGGTSRMAFDRKKPSDPLSIRFCGWGAEVECPGSGERSIIVNMAMRPWVRAAATGRFLPTSADQWGRVEVRVPDGLTRFDVFYQLPWRRGLLMGGCLLAATLVGVFLVRIIQFVYFPTAERAKSRLTRQK